MQKQGEPVRSKSAPASSRSKSAPLYSRPWVWRTVMVLAYLVVLLLPPLVDLLFLDRQVDAVLWLYPLVGAIGTLVGAGELLGRYRDAPFLALAQNASILYLAVNAAAAMGALYLILAFGWTFGLGQAADTQNVEPVRVVQVLVAGFGAMAVLRSSLFTARIGESNVELGPATVLQTVLNAADAEIDRAAAERRAQSARKIMNGVDADKAKATLPLYCYRLTQSSLSNSDYEVMNQKIKAIYEEGANGRSKRSKVYTLGIILMNYLGEEALQAAVKALRQEIKEDGDEAAMADGVPERTPAPEASRTEGTEPTNNGPPGPPPHP